MNKRPAGVWLVFLFYLLWSILALIGAFAILVGGVAPSDGTYMAAVGTLGGIIALILGTLNFAGAMYFFLLRRVSALLFSVALALNLAYSVMLHFQTNWASVPTHGLFFSLVSWGMQVFVVLYAWNLVRKGMLT